MAEHEAKYCVYIKLRPHNTHMAPNSLNLCKAPGRTKAPFDTNTAPACSKFGAQHTDACRFVFGFGVWFCVCVWISFFAVGRKT